MQVALISLVFRLTARLGVEVHQAAVWIALEAVHAALSQPVAERRLRVAAAHRDEHRLVVLVAVAVEHQQDSVERQEGDAPWGL